MRPHDAEKLGRMRTELAVKLGALTGVSDSRIAAQHSARQLNAEAVQLAGIRGWDARRSVGELLETLQSDHDAMADDPRRVDTVRKIAAAMVKARAAIAARNHADAMGQHQTALEAEIAPLQRLVTACDAWLKEEA